MKNNMKEYKSKEDVIWKDLQFFNSLSEEFKDNPELMVQKILSIFYGIKTKQYKEMEKAEIAMLVTELSLVLSQPKGEFRNIIEVCGKQYGFIPNFAKITAGELIDIDSCLAAEDFDSLTSILYRPIKDEITPTGEYKVKKYKGYNKTFENVSQFIVEGYLERFKQEYGSIKSDYPHLFNPEDTDSQNNDGGVILGYTETQEFHDDYGPYVELIYLISKGNLLIKDKITKMNVHEFLWMGEYLIRKRKIEAKASQSKK